LASGSPSQRDSCRNCLAFPGNPSADNFFSEMRAVFDQVDRVSWTTVAFSAATIAVLVGLRRLVPRIPGPLVAVGGGIVLVAATSIDKHGLALIARVPSGRPSPIAPSFAHFGALLPGAFAIAIMVFLETLAVARSVRRASEPAIDNNQELVASGLSWAFPRPRSTSAPAPEPNSASSSPSGSRSHVRCFSAACSAIFPIGWAVELADEPHLDLWRAIPTRGRLMTLCQPIARARVRTCRLSAASSPVGPRLELGLLLARSMARTGERRERDARDQRGGVGFRDPPAPRSWSGGAAGGDRDKADPAAVASPHRGSG
jgi:hypothetical protein